MPSIASPDMRAGDCAASPLQLLVVDDDDVDRERVTRLLAKLHLRNSVTEAATLDEAREALRRSEFDCVFLDYQVGSHIGTDLLYDIQRGLQSYVPVVMVTGTESSRLVVETMQDGACDFIQKASLHVDLLETVLMNSLHRAAAERDLLTKRERLEFLSFHDQLTGLPNRSLFFDRLEQTLRSAKRAHRVFGLLQIDLNLFKEVNDTYGHAVGDMVLMTTAHRLKKALRESDTVARLGGDEFSVLLPDLASPEDATLVAEKISAAIREPISTDKHLIRVGSAVGIATYPAQGEDTHTLLQRADRAMYEAKRRGIRHVVYHDDITGIRKNPLLEVSRLQRAIEEDELFVEFQPIVNLRTRKVTGAEALVRWRTADGEIIPPGVFIPIAERGPLIRALSYSVLEKVLTQVKAWREMGLTLPGSINMSACALDDDELAHQIFSRLAAHGLPTSLLTVEITETALMSNPEQAKKALCALTAGGVRVSIDDFGTGFTSFKYLREIDVSEIKIDMAFTADLRRGSRDRVIVESIAKLAEGFGIPAVAEGVEDLGNCATLMALGCHCGQGYGIARPMSGHEIPKWIAGWMRAPS